MSESAVRGAVAAAVEWTDSSFLERARREQLADGTTAVWALLFRQHLVVGHLGDSRALLCRSTATPATTPVQAMACLLLDKIPETLSAVKDKLKQLLDEIKTLPYILSTDMIAQAGPCHSCASSTWALQLKREVERKGPLHHFSPFIVHRLDSKTLCLFGRDDRRGSPVRRRDRTLRRRAVHALD